MGYDMYSMSVVCHILWYDGVRHTRVVPCEFYGTVSFTSKSWDEW